MRKASVVDSHPPPPPAANARALCCTFHSRSAVQTSEKQLSVRWRQLTSSTDATSTMQEANGMLHLFFLSRSTEKINTYRDSIDFTSKVHLSLPYRRKADATTDALNFPKSRVENCFHVPKLQTDAKKIKTFAQSELLLYPDPDGW